MFGSNLIGVVGVMQLYIGNLLPNARFPENRSKGSVGSVRGNADRLGSAGLTAMACHTRNDRRAERIALLLH